MILTVGKLKKILENYSDDTILLSSEEGNRYELEEVDVSNDCFEYPTEENGKIIIKKALQIG